jgi:ABC-type amino acid transport substrate-binding protein
MFRILTCFAAALFLVAASARAQQPSRLDDIVKRGTLRVGMTGDYLPFTYLDKATSKFRGFDVDMAEALGKALGVKVCSDRVAAVDQGFRCRPFRYRNGRRFDHARSAEKGDVLNPGHA